MGSEPVADLLMQPAILFPDDVKVTVPAAPTETERVAATPFAMRAGTVRVTEIEAPELFVIDRDEIAAISLPA